MHNRGSQQSSRKGSAIPALWIMMTAFVTLIIFSLQPAHQRTMSELEVIQVPVSREGLTRITVRDDRIVNLFGLSNEFLLEADENQGQVFVRPQGSGVEGPISITITTEGGHTQDLRLIPRDQSPETLILVKEETIESRRKVHRTITRETVQELLLSLREGSVPNGYIQRMVDLKEQAGPHIILREVRNESLSGQTLEVTNPGDQILYLNPQDYGNAPGVIAVSLSRKALKPQERGEVYVVREVL